MEHSDLNVQVDIMKASASNPRLGAREAKELRGERLLLSTLPHLIERSRQQEPLKVTLQISHKGIKIVQGSAKHFIPHNAVTCSIVADDVVACVLLLYNPETRCPLHVHCYRCDSEVTAIALNEHLQTLIKKPENQKKFAELEAKLHKATTSRTPSVTMPITSEGKSKFDIVQRRFEASLGSDAGTSRESECSEENQRNSPIDRSSQLFDSLAAELKQKLKGNGPPLLLPPRDYDTISRSQGNLKAVEMRRSKNTAIVGAKEAMFTKKLKTSSHDSSGIGSDELTPSPDRLRCENISNGSSDDWKNEISKITKKIEHHKISSSNVKNFRDMKYRGNSPVSNSVCERPVSDNCYNFVSKKTKIKENRDTFLDREVDETYKNEEKVSGLMREQSERYRFAMQRMNQGRDKLYKQEKYELNKAKPQTYDTAEASRKVGKSKIGSPANIPLLENLETSDRHSDINPYREIESLPYQQSNDMFCRDFHRKSTNGGRVRELSPVLSTMKRTSPKDRFINAKEKFQAFDSRRYEEQEFSRRNIYQHQNHRLQKQAQYVTKNSTKYKDDDDYLDPSMKSLMPAKSLGNLARNRHSYSEPVKFYSCNRVGLARIT